MPHGRRHGKPAGTARRVHGRDGAAGGLWVALALDRATRCGRSAKWLGAMNDLRNGALRLLAENPDGCTAARMVAHGFVLEVLIELIVAGLATTQTEQVGRASQPMGRTHFRITEAGRRALQ